jgi:oligopeptide/dipeptide ABC transporter ATP-binding protein
MTVQLQRKLAAAISANGREITLEVKNLKVYYGTPTGNVRAVDDVSFHVYKGEILGLVGESGCGKTTTAMAILRMVQPPGRIVGGQVLLDGIDLVGLSEAALRDVRWNTLALIPQGAMNSLNPVMRIHTQIAEVIQTHEGRQPKDKLKKRIFDLLSMVSLPSRIYDMYPHELSGGMKQRVCIAMAIALHPSLIIADEPTSALDVVVQRVVGQTLLDVKERMNVSMLLIGHDMGLQAQLVDRIAVMYAGHMVEVAPVEAIFSDPLHPYTQLLIESIPSIKERKPLKLTEGLTHDLRNPPPGCIFQERCPKVMDVCRVARPWLRQLKPEHYVACHLYE